MSRRAERLLQIIQILRRCREPVPARKIAAELEVATRTIYRDIFALTSSGVPIRGEAGIGYVLEDGYDLPPLMFNIEELEALILGVRLVQAQGDNSLARSARDATAKIAAILPARLSAPFLHASLYAPDFGNKTIDKIDVSTIRQAIRERQKLSITYEKNTSLQPVKRTIWPIVLAYHNDTRLLAAWCELRDEFRHFRVDRICDVTQVRQRIPERYEFLFSRWHKEEMKKGQAFQLVTKED